MCVLCGYVLRVLCVCVCIGLCESEREIERERKRERGRERESEREREKGVKERERGKERHTVHTSSPSTVPVFFTVTLMLTLPPALMEGGLTVKAE